MGVRILQIDSFTDRPSAGNPAAVCLLKEERDAGWMQAVAAEINLSEIAFIRPLDGGIELRWFTPAIEVELCGHATLGSAHALWTEGLVKAGHLVRFHTKSGVLTCRRLATLSNSTSPQPPHRKRRHSRDCSMHLAFSRASSVNPSSTSLSVSSRWRTRQRDRPTAALDHIGANNWARPR